jgi:hypothetical protein
VCVAVTVRLRFGIAGVPVVFQHPQRCPAGEVLNHAQVAACFEDQGCPRGYEAGPIEEENHSQNEHEDRGEDPRKQRGPIVRLNVSRKPISPNKRIQGEVVYRRSCFSFR